MFYDSKMRRVWRGVRAVPESRRSEAQPPRAQAVPGVPTGTASLAPTQTGRPPCAPQSLRGVRTRISDEDRDRWPEPLALEPSVLPRLFAVWCAQHLDVAPSAGWR